MFFRYLTDKYKRMMRNKELSPDQLRRDAEAMRTKNRKTFKWVVLFMAFLFVLFICSIVFEDNHMTKAESLPIDIAISALIVAVASAFVYFCTIGNLKWTFNKELRKNYPELYDEIKL